MLRNMRSLSTYVQVVESGSLSAAARALAASLPMVSRDLAHLEETLGVVLLQRTTRRLSVTDEGAAFYRRARRIIDEWSAAVDDLRPAADAVHGTVRLIMPTVTLPNGLPQALGELMDLYPDLRLQIATTDQPVDLVGGGWDIGVFLGSPRDSTHVVRYLVRMPGPLAAAPAYVERRGLPAHPRELEQHECLRFLHDREQKQWTLMGPGGATQAWPVGGRLEMRSSGALAACLFAGLGIGPVLRGALPGAVERGELVHVLPEWAWEETPMYALVPQGRIAVPRVRAVLDWLTDYAAGLA